MIRKKAIIQIILILTVFLPLDGAVLEPPLTPVFTIDSFNISSTGHFKLTWETRNTDIIYDTFQIQQSLDSLFENPKTIYTGPDQATFISGLPNGKYFYRARFFHLKSESPWNKPIVLLVQHQSLKLAKTLLIIGALVFLLTTLVIVVGIRSSKNPL